MSMRIPPARLVLGLAASSALFACGHHRSTPSASETQLQSVVQDRTVDPSGRTVRMSFGVPLWAATATDSDHYVASGRQKVETIRLASPSSVILEFDQLVIPGETTFEIAGLLTSDGTPVPPVAGVSLASTDTVGPTVTAAAATAVENARNDVITVRFDDDMIPAEVIDSANLRFEHPIGTAISLEKTARSYDASKRELTVVCNDASAAIDLHFGVDWRLSLEGARDLGGNALAAVTLSGAVVGDGKPPVVVAATQNTTVDPSGSTVDVAFSEQVDLARAQQILNYVQSNGGGRPAMSAVRSASGDSVRVTFASAVMPGVETLSVQGVADLASNAMAPDVAIAIRADDAIAPALASVAAITSSGPGNDLLTVVFDEAVLPAGAQVLSNFTLESPIGTPVALGSDTQVHYDPQAFTTTLLLSSQVSPLNLATGASFALTVRNVQDVAGNVVAAVPYTGTVGGDAVAPRVLSQGVVQKTSLNPIGTTVDVAFDEVVDRVFAERGTSYALDIGQPAIWAVAVGRGDIVRVTFAMPVPAGSAVTVQNVKDLAGNTMAAAPMQVVSEETVPPAVVAATATAVSGRQNDVLTVQFTEPVLPSDATSIGNYVLESPPGTVLPLDGFTAVSYDVLTMTATVVLTSSATPVNLGYNNLFKVTVQNIRDVAGNVMPAFGNTFTARVVGDSTKPTKVSAAPAPTYSRILEVTFSEQLDPASVASATWVFSQPLQLTNPGATTLTSDGRTVRITTLTPNLAGYTVDCDGIRDLAGNLLDSSEPPIVIQ
jgi:hypothetical protein